MKSIPNDELNKQWMVYDSESEDAIYHETKEKAMEDFDDALSSIVKGQVILFEVIKVNQA